jgi:tetratricopeptide (TPR) repeat protein
MTTAQNPGRIFVSYAGRDRAWAEWVAYQLRAEGIDVEFDLWDWATGDDFVRRMASAGERADLVVALISSAYLERESYSTDEWTAVLAPQSRRLVLIRIEDVRMPPILRQTVTADLFGRSPAEARGILLAAVMETPMPGTSLSFYPGNELPSGPRLPGELPPVWNVPIRAQAFTGRDTVLAGLRGSFLASPGRTSVQVLTGLGGVGKTQIAIEYAHRFANNYAAVWWIDAEVTNFIPDQLVALAVALAVVPSDAPSPSALPRLFHYLQGRDDWLIVFDQAAEQADLADSLPSGPGHVLVTSRNPNWQQLGTRIAIEPFGNAESTAFLRSLVPDVSDQDATQIGNRLGGLPLALAQAAGLLAETAMRPAEYLRALDEHAIDVLSYTSGTGHERSVANVVALSMSRLEAEDMAAALLMRICSFLAPEPIPLWLFSDAPDDALPDPLAAVARTTISFRRTLSRLSAFGLARVDADSLQLHRLVQGVLRASRSDDEPIASLVERLLAAAPLAAPADPYGWPAWSVVLPHLLAWDPRLARNARLRRRLGDGAWYLLSRGAISAGMSVASGLFQAWEEARGPDDPYTLNAAKILAEAMRGLGDFTGAEQLDSRIHETRLRTLGRDHPQTLSAAHNLAIDLRGVQRLAEAQSLHEEVLAARTRLFGDADFQTIQTLNQLALDQLDRGGLGEARGNFERVLKWLRAQRGEDSPETLGVANNLALTLLRLAELDEARDLFHEVRTRYQRVVGDDHPSTLTASEGMAAALRAIGDASMARELDADTYARRRRVLGDDHPDTRRSHEAMSTYPE